jgi:hypothetical protein
VFGVGSSVDQNHGVDSGSSVLARPRFMVARRSGVRAWTSEHFDADVIGRSQPHLGDDHRWRNLWRPTDPIGSRIAAVDDHQQIADDIDEGDTAHEKTPAFRRARSDLISVLPARAVRPEVLLEAVRRTGYRLPGSRLSAAGSPGRCPLPGPS